MNAFYDDGFKNNVSLGLRQRTTSEICLRMLSYIFFYECLWRTQY